MRKQERFTKSLLFLILCFSFVAHAFSSEVSLTHEEKLLLAQGCNSQRNTKTVYINGVNNSFVQAANSFLDISQAYRDKLESDYPNEHFGFALSYNHSDGLAFDLIQTLKQKMDEAGNPEVFGLSPEELFINLMALVDSGLALRGVGMTSDFRDSLIKLAQEYPAQRMKEPAEVKKHLEKILHEMDFGGRVLIIAHSQGNLIAQKVIEEIRANPDYRDSVGMIGVASPASRLPYCPFGQGIIQCYWTAYDDFVIELVRETVGAIPSNVKNDIDSEKRSYSDLFNHSFLGSYFSFGIPSRALIDADVNSWMKALEFPNKADVAVLLSWEGNADVDLHVYEPSSQSLGTHVFHGNPVGEFGTYDKDFQSGGKSEIYCIREVDASGDYVLAMNYYSGNGPQAVTVKVVEANGENREIPLDLAEPKGPDGEDDLTEIATMSVSYEESKKDWTLTLTDPPDLRPTMLSENQYIDAMATDHSGNIFYIQKNHSYGGSESSFWYEWEYQLRRIDAGSGADTLRSTLANTRVAGGSGYSGPQPKAIGDALLAYDANNAELIYYIPELVGSGQPIELGRINAESYSESLLNTPAWFKPSTGRADTAIDSIAIDSIGNIFYIQKNSSYGGSESSFWYEWEYQLRRIDAGSGADTLRSTLANTRVAGGSGYSGPQPKAIGDALLAYDANNAELIYYIPELVGSKQPPELAKINPLNLNKSTYSLPSWYLPATTKTSSTVDSITMGPAGNLYYIQKYYSYKNSPNFEWEYNLRAIDTSSDEDSAIESVGSAIVQGMGDECGQPKASGDTLISYSPANNQLVRYLPSINGLDCVFELSNLSTIAIPK